MSVTIGGTGVDIAIDGAPRWNHTGYTATEDSTPVDPGDTSGGFGQITTTIWDSPDAKTLTGKPIEVFDGRQGRTRGVIRGLTGNETGADITANGPLGKSAVHRSVGPYIGSLGGAFRSYLRACGITTNIRVDLSLENVQVALPGWSAVVYDQLKRLAVAHKAELTAIGDEIVLRVLRGREAETYRISSATWTLDETQLAQTVTGTAYVTRPGTELAYPPGGWNEDVAVHAVDASGRVELDLPIEGSLSSVEQPVCVDWVDRYEASRSVYCVVGNDGLPVKASQWTADGGSLTVEIGEDTRSLKVVITGAASTEFAPYRIAMSAGPSDMYSSLRIRGSGVFYSKETITLPACIDKDRAPNEIGQDVDGEFYPTAERLYHGLLWTAARYTSPRYTINVSSAGINRIGDGETAVFPTIADVDAAYPGYTIARMANALGPTIADWNEKLFARVQGDFANQAFGNVAGARVKRYDSWFRIRSATITPSSVQFSAEQDNTIDDVSNTGETIADWNDRWAGRTIAEFNLAPLRAAPYVEPRPTLYPRSDVFPGGDTFPSS